VALNSFASAFRGRSQRAAHSGASYYVGGIPAVAKSIGKAVRRTGRLPEDLTARSIAIEWARRESTIKAEQFWSGLQWVGIIVGLCLFYFIPNWGIGFGVFLQAIALIVAVSSAREVHRWKVSYRKVLAELAYESRQDKWGQQRK
jgi:hypothetical protein